VTLVCPVTMSSPVRDAFEGSRSRGKDLARVGITAFPLIEENPYQRLLYRELAHHGLQLVRESHFKLGWLWRSRRRVRVLHFHWPQNYYRWWRRPRTLEAAFSWVKLALHLTRLAAARLLGYRVVWTIHEVLPHERSRGRVDPFAARMLARLATALIAHEEATAGRARAEVGRAGKKIQVIPHGSYIGVYPPGRPRSVVRAELGVSPQSFCFLCFGHVRGYKALDILLEAFAAAALPEASLLIAGLVIDERAAAAVQTAADADPRVRPLLTFIPESRVEELFAACDAAVFPRGDGGTSGALILALSLGVPVIAARTPAYEELTQAEESGWLFVPGDEHSLRAALERAATDPIAAREKGAAGLQRAHTLRWPQIAEETAMLMLSNGRDALRPSGAPVHE
jgi:beta-1,4-mannosyltransferase